MAVKVILPKQGLQMTEGTIIEWIVKEGERVEAGKPLFEMETDKLSIVIDAPATGTLLKIIKAEGETVPVTEVIAVIGEPGEDISGIPMGLSGSLDGAGGATAAAASAAMAVVATIASVAASADETAASNCAPKRVNATPRAKTLAAEAGVDISYIHGSGLDGIVTDTDVKEYLGKRQAHESNTPSGEDFEVIPFTAIRKVISDKMMKSIHSMAQANLKVKADMTSIINIREKLKAENVKVSYTDMFLKISAKALAEFPYINSSYSDEGIILKKHINIGIAVALDDGLLVPVVRDADRMSLKEISRSTASLIEKAKTGTLMPDDYKGGTFTITNLGMYDIDEFTAIINPPEAAILAVGKITDTPVCVDGAVEIRPLMTLTLTYDHRIIDGAPAAEFLQYVRELLQNPYFVI